MADQSVLLPKSKCQCVPGKPVVDLVTRSSVSCFRDFARYYETVEPTKRQRDNVLFGRNIFVKSGCWIEITPGIQAPVAVYVCARLRTFLIRHCLSHIDWHLS